MRFNEADIAAALGATSARCVERVQSLWSGYGEIVRVALEGHADERIIVKRVEPPAEAGSRSHRRKLRSYAIEERFYRDFSARLDPRRCRTPVWLGSLGEPGGGCLLLEDLDAAGFAGRRGPVEPCLRWLATFHATFLGTPPEGLWETGTYWHLETRPDELEATRDAALREAAPDIDARLEAARFKTLVHGDAKLANFCFAEGGDVAALDFQYVGGGCGVKDVVYLLSGLSEVRLERDADHLLDLYFDALRAALSGDVDADALEAEWRALIPWAWADFMRFLAGWSPAAFAGERYGRRILAHVLAQR